jgi:hypothetical protein
MTKRFPYKAPAGHLIYAEPTWQHSGDGHVRVMNRTDHGFDYEITSIKGKYTVNFTSYERWMHKCDTGEFYHPKAID